MVFHIFAMPQRKQNLTLMVARDTEDSYGYRDTTTSKRKLLDIVIAGGRHWMSEQLYDQLTTRTENHSQEVARTDGALSTKPNRTKDRSGPCLSALPKVLLYFLIFASPAFGQASGGEAVPSTPGSYSL